MSDTYLLDTGPLVAVLRRDDAHHEWAKETMAQLRSPFRTCEPVISEACFLLGANRGAVLALLTARSVEITFSLKEHLAAVGVLMSKYADVPMALADACLVRMAEIEPKATILTCDSDFKLYRKNRAQKLKLLTPR